MKLLQIRPDMSVASEIAIKSLHAVRFIIKRGIDVITCLVVVLRKIERAFGRRLGTQKSNSKSEPTQILLVNFQGLGDLLSITPFFESLRRTDLKITIVTVGKNGEFLKNYPNCTVIVLEKGLFGFFHTLRKIREERFDIAVNLYKAEHSAFFVANSGADCIMWPLWDEEFRIDGKNAKNYREKLANTNPFYGSTSKKALRDPKKISFAALAALSIEPVRDIWDYYLELPTEAIKYAKDLLPQDSRFAKTVTVFADNQWISRSWPIENFEAVISELLARGTRVVLVGTDTNAKSHILLQARFAPEPGFIDTVGQTDVFQSGAILRLCDVFLTTDSGPMHLALASGCPKVVAMFGPTDAKMFFPNKKPHIALVDESFPMHWNWNNEPVTRRMMDIAPETVLTAII